MAVALLRKFEAVTVFSSEAVGAVVSWDDVSDKLEADPELVRELGLSLDEVDSATGILRKIMDNAHKLRAQLKIELESMLQRDGRGSEAEPAEGQPEASRGAEVEPEDTALKARGNGPEVERDSGSPVSHGCGLGGSPQ